MADKETPAEPTTPPVDAPAEPEPTHAREGELFPHVYGPINLDAVTNVVPFEPDEDGNFTLPETLSG